MPILAKADSMTVEELQAFRRDVRDALAQVRAHAGSMLCLESSDTQRQTSCQHLLRVQVTTCAAWRGLMHSNGSALSGAAESIRAMF